MNSSPKVSVIIPVFKVEKHIEKCARSLFEQTLSNIEFIFIDDSTPDQSVALLQEVIEEYPGRKDQVKIIQHQSNKGISATRNTGVNHASGEYLIHCDSDDWINPDMYEQLYLKAIEGDCDIVYCDHVREYPDRQSIQSTSIRTAEQNNYLRAAITGKISPYVWDKLVRRSLYTDNNLQFPEGVDIREDYYMTIKLFYYSYKLCKVPSALYHYRIADNSISRLSNGLHAHSFKIKDRIEATELVCDFLKEQKAFEQYKREIMLSKLYLKRLILFHSNNAEKWIGLYPEATRYIPQSNYTIYTKLILLISSTRSTYLFKFLKKIRQASLKLAS